jgi:hypothetical protein
MDSEKRKQLVIVNKFFKIKPSKPILEGLISTPIHVLPFYSPHVFCIRDHIPQSV